MIFQLFYLLILTSAFFVITLRNPIYSVLALISVFFNLALMLLCLEVEFLSLVFLVVYVGAIAVLFLFVVMMLNVSKESYSTREHYYPLLSSLALVLFFIVCYIFVLVYDLQFYFFDIGFLENLSRPSYYSDYAALIGAQTNSQNLAQVLYSYNFIPFFLSGLVLLVAMIGSIALTIYHREDTRRQLIFKQVERSYEHAIRLTDLKTTTVS